jgi:hypothetical protein
MMTASAVASWKQVADRLEKALTAFSDADLQREVAPGRNRIYYLIGHLAAVSDRMLPLLFVGDRLHPEFDEPFLTQPDRAVSDAFSSTDLKRSLAAINRKLTEAFENMEAEDWLKRHSAVSEEEFAKEPLRNRLAVLLSRTNHMSFHLGQILLVK